MFPYLFVLYFHAALTQQDAFYWGSTKFSEIPADQTWKRPKHPNRFLPDAKIFIGESRSKYPEWAVQKAPSRSAERLAPIPIANLDAMPPAARPREELPSSNYRSPPPPRRRDVQMEPRCSYDPETWAMHPESTIAHAVMFERATGGSCEQCLARCAAAQSSDWRCRSATYDTKWRICDLYAIQGTEEPFVLVDYPGRDYYEYKLYDLALEVPTLVQRDAPSCEARILAISRRFEEEKAALTLAVHGVRSIPDTILNAAPSTVTQKSTASHQKLSNPLPSPASRATRKRKVMKRKKTIKRRRAKVAANRRELLKEMDLLRGLEMADKISPLQNRPNQTLHRKPPPPRRRVQSHGVSILKNSLDPIAAPEKLIRLGSTTPATQCSPERRLLYLVFEKFDRPYIDALQVTSNTSLKQCVASCTMPECQSMKFARGVCRLAMDTLYQKLIPYPFKQHFFDPSTILYAVRNHALVGAVEQIQTAASLTECIDLCFAAKKLSGFNCSSATWYGNDREQNCLLNSGTRWSRNAAFIKSDVPLVYFEAFDASLRTNYSLQTIKKTLTPPNQWTFWSTCSRPDVLWRHRYKKCSEPDVRHCVKEVAPCKVKKRLAKS